MESFASLNNNMVFLEIIKQLENVVNDLSGKKNSYLSSQIKQLKNIIIMLNKLINETKKNQNEIMKRIQKLNDDMKSHFNKISINYNYQKKTYPNGEYFGELRNGLRHGKGTFKNKDGSEFNGQWEEDKTNGYGEEMNKVYKSEGLYKNGELYGYLKYEFHDGNSILLFLDEDKLKKGLGMCGKGIIYYKQGGRYEGDIKNGSKDGEGIFYWKEGEKDIGKFSDDKPIGKHVKIKKNGEVERTDYGGEEPKITFLGVEGLSQGQNEAFMQNFDQIISNMMMKYNDDI